MGVDGKGVSGKAVDLNFGVNDGNENTHLRLHFHVFFSEYVGLIEL